MRLPGKARARPACARVLLTPMAPQILVVDDNQELLSLLTQLFEDAGYQVIPAAKGKTGLDQARTHKPELAILDILLPDMMGHQLADGLRRDNPQLPLIF